MRKLIILAFFVLMAVPSFAQNHQDYTLPDAPKRSRYIDYPSQYKGLWFAVQATPAYASLEGITGQVDFILGYRTGEWFRVGAGVSPKFSTEAGFGLPVYLDLRGNIISQESRMAVPYWSFDAGYTISSTNSGLYLSPTLGVRVGMPRNNFIAGLTYIMQQLPSPVSSSRLSHGVGLRIGYEF